eukprot:1192127-Prorocentrum_minimum.AAC.1
MFGEVDCDCDCDCDWTGTGQVEKQQLPRVAVAEVEVALGAEANVPKSFAPPAERKALHLRALSTQAFRSSSLEGIRVTNWRTASSVAITELQLQSLIVSFLAGLGGGAFQMCCRGNIPSYGYVGWLEREYTFAREGIYLRMRSADWCGAERIYLHMAMLVCDTAVRGPEALWALSADLEAERGPLPPELRALIQVQHQTPPLPSPMV